MHRVSTILKVLSTAEMLAFGLGERMVTIWF